MIKNFLLMALFAIGSLHAAAAQEPMRLFEEESYQSILADQRGKPFLMVLWSLDCSHCMKELQMLGEVTVNRPELNLVLIATDSPQDREELQQIVNRNGVRYDSSWVFSEENAPRLRYQIDKRWYGELPRSYLFDARHNRKAISGVLKRDDIDNLLSVVDRQ